MSSIAFQHYIGGVLTDAAQIKLKDATNTYGIKNTDTGAVVLAPTTPITSTSTGVYSYDVSSLPVSTTYEVVWEIYYPTTAATPQYVIQIFSLDPASVSYNGPRLMDIERRVAQRAGPNRMVYASAGGSSLVIPSNQLKSSINRNPVTDLYILRRGLKRDGSHVVGLDSDDRIRLVASFDHTTGRVVPDRAYTTATVVDECIEFVYIDPLVMRDAVLAGLSRCFILDSIDVTSTSYTSELNLTGLAPWLLRPNQLKRIMSGGTGVYRPLDLEWFNLDTRQGSLYVDAVRNPFLSTLTVRAMRPADTYVNGQTTLTGPDDDEDVLMVPLSYAVAAGHIELWRIARAELQAAAQIGFQITQKEAAEEFTKQSRKYIVKEPEFMRFSQPFGFRELQQP